MSKAKASTTKKLGRDVYLGKKNRCADRERKRGIGPQKGNGAEFSLGYGISERKKKEETPKRKREKFLGERGGTSFQTPAAEGRYGKSENYKRDGKT